DECQEMGERVNDLVVVWHTLMDYDDSDGQYHNLRLAGEERAKPSLLRPYAFPKFDFDDSLPGQLRFDSLVESEVFLGAQGQEDNQWIQDFSRTNDVIEFSPSASESCSLSRRNNVWSEATSSESVEMLLNSVGQEEMVPEETLVEESNDFDELSCLAKQMEHNQQLIDGKNQLVDPKASTVQVALVETIPGLDVAKDLPEIEVINQFQGMEETSSCLGASSDACTSVVGISSFDSNGNDGNGETEAKVSSDGAEFLVSKPFGEDSYDSAAPMDNFEYIAGSFSSTRNGKQVSVHSLESAGHQLKDIAYEDKQSASSANSRTNVQISDNNIQDHAVNMVQIRPPSVSAVSITIGRSPDTIEESACTSQKDECLLKELKTDGKNVSCTNPDQMVDVQLVPTNEEMSNQFGGNYQGRGRDDDIVKHASQFIVSNTSHGGSVLKVESGIQSDQRQEKEQLVDVPECSHGKVSDVSGNTSHALLFLGEEIVLPAVKASGNIDSDASACHSDTALEMECLDKVPRSISVNDNSGLVCEVALVTENSNADTIEHDYCVTSSSGKVTYDLRNTNPVVETATSDELVGSASVRSTVTAGVAVHNLRSGISSELESGNRVLPLEKNLDPAAAINLIEEKGQPSGVGETDIDEGKEVATRISSFNVMALGATEVVAVVEAEVCVEGEASGAGLSDAAERTLPSMDNDATSTTNLISMVKTDSVKSFSEESHSHLIRKAVDKEVDTGQVLTESHVCDNASAQPLDQKAGCDSPTTISSKDLSQNGIGNFEEGKDIQSVAEDPGIKATANMDDSSFTFKVNTQAKVPVKENRSSWAPFPCCGTSNSSTVVGEDISASAATTTPERSHKGSDTGRKPPRSASERKNRRGAGKGKSKEAIPDELTGKENKLSDLPLRPFGGSPRAKFPKMQPYVGIELNNTKSSGLVSSPASSLPDLNSSKNSTSVPTATFHQPFSDMQQVQLRAQIFVYGSLIQGAAPDEPCMIAAFGPSDGGRSVWESSWLAAVERVHNQKSRYSGAETPLVSHSKVHDPATKSVSLQNRLPPSPGSRASDKAGPAMLVNPSVIPSSPLWTMPTPSRDSLHASGLQRGLFMDFQPPLSPLHSYQNPPVRNLAATTPWPSQGPFPAAWVPVTRMTSDASAHLAPMLMTEAINLTPARDPCGPSTPGVILATSSPLLHSEVSTTLFAGVSPIAETAKRTVSSEQHSADAKPKKRKKVTPSAGLAQTSLISDTRTKPVLPFSVMIPPTSLVVVSETRAEPVINSPTMMLTSPSVVVSDTRAEQVVVSPMMMPTSSMANVPAPAFLIPSINMSESVDTMTPISSAKQLKKVDSDPGKKSASSEDSMSKVVEAKMQAEKAASLAALAVSHCEGVWNQLAEQKEAGLTSEVEAKLASAAVAIAAAASVAKAAAAAAEIASNAALQAKLMADEALISVNAVKPAEGGGVSSKEVHHIEKATPLILKADLGYTESTSILVAAKEAAKRRLEAASAASKQAENLDAIVKAAELAAEAVSQTGKIVSMGEPQLLSELMIARPDICWKLPPASSALGVEENGENRGETSVRKGEDTSIKGLRSEVPHEQGVTSVSEGKTTPARKSSNGTLNVNARLMDDCVTSVPLNSQGIVIPLEVPSRTDLFPQLDGMPTDHGPHKKEDDKMDTWNENTIRAGCTVEVLRDGDGLKPGWFSARALALDDRKAFVSYEDLLAADGSGNLKEWVPLEVDGGNTPRIRLPYSPPTSLEVQGTKKRRRSYTIDYAWAVGDKVDVLIKNCWCEGVLTEENKKDATSFVVHFPAHGETTVVRAWQLRPSRTWSGEKWIAWSSARKHKMSHLGDMPKEKRQKLAAFTMDTEEKGKITGDISHVSGKPEETNPLSLRASEKVFNVGKSSSAENKAAHRTLRTGLQKEGSTIYGLPKPGKKRKFMDVSKHFPADKHYKTKEVDDSTRYSKHLVPQASIPRGLRNTSKVDSKAKQATQSRVGVSGARRAPSVSSRTMPQRENSDNSVLALCDETVSDHGTATEDSVDHENVVDKSILVEDRSSSGTEDASEAPLSSLYAVRKDGSSKKVSLSNSESERPTKRKAASSTLTKIDEEQVYDGSSAKSGADVFEPRRSNRRIQPTHRLLEGLQSAMVIPKMASISQDKGPKTNKSSFSKARWV
ncbi:hypothetical protein Drorol1_Dr00000055, partial [Drosera rotundifolia]